jgi:nicotinate-nucleotide pyrophosphorylase (carboxylating)
VQRDPCSSAASPKRTVPRCLQRMSGIATATAAMVAACAGNPATVLDTRKTVPGLRVLDKWAVRIGGGATHRMGLYDMIMIKDNHIAAAGGLGAAVDQACAHAAAQERRIEIEVETRTLEEVQELLACLDAGRGKGVTRVMLDNMARRDASCSGACQAVSDRSSCSKRPARCAGRMRVHAAGIDKLYFPAARRRRTPWP